MMAAVIVISLLVLTGACFPNTQPSISNLRRRTPRLDSL